MKEPSSIEHYQPSTYKKLVRKVLAFFLTRFILPIQAKKFSRFDQSIGKYHGEYAKQRCEHFSASQLGRHYGLDKAMLKLKDKGERTGKQALGLLRKTFPIQTSSDFYQSWGKKAQEGKHVVWDERIQYYGYSSGTTSTRKKMPVVQSTVGKLYRQAGLALQSLIREAKNKSVNCFAGETLSLCGSVQDIIPTPYGNAQLADISAFLSHPECANDAIKRWLLGIFLPFSPNIITGEYDTKKAIYIQELPHTQVSQLYGVSKRQKDLLHSIWTKYNENISEKKDWKAITSLLPFLDVVVGGGVDIRPYMQTYKDMGLTPEQHLLQVYNATEGLYAAQAWTDRDENNEPTYGYNENGETVYRLLPGTHIAEFVPLCECIDGIPKKDARSYFVHELHEDMLYDIDENNKKHYKQFVFVPTSPGLPRLVMDTVSICSIHPLRFVIQGRNDSINLGGEEFSASHAISAMKQLNKDTKENRENFSVSIAQNDDCRDTSINRHERCIELPSQTTYTPEQLQTIVQKIDTFAQAAKDYKTKRTTISQINKDKDSPIMRLDVPLIKFVPTGTFHRFDKARNRIGSQYKIPIVSNTREKFIDPFLTRCRAENIEIVTIDLL